MKLKCILINPWIYDFAAVNLWSRPLGLLKVAEYLSQFDIELKLIDCTNILKTERKFGTGKYPRQIVEKPEILSSFPRNFSRYGISIENFIETIKNHLPCDIVFITSIMSYWYPGVQKAIEIVKSLTRDTPVILGGIYATLYYKHALENSGADYIFRGHINSSTSPPFNRRGNVRSPALPAMKMFSYLNIEAVINSFGFTLIKKHKPQPYYKLGLYHYYSFAPLLTGEGCPYKCSYCASSLLFNGFTQREPSHVMDEIRELYRIGIRDYAFYDDALLVNANTHLKILLGRVIKSGLKIRFHCPNGIHARFIDDEVGHMMRQSGFSTLRLSLETVNSERQAKSGGKITSEIFKSAVKNLKKKGFTKDHIGVYLMYGLPGQRLEEVKDGVEFLKELDVRIHLTEFSPIPGTSCWEELKSEGIIDDNIDPLLTNNTVFTNLYSGYNLDALEKLKLEVKQYNSSY